MATKQPHDEDPGIDISNVPDSLIPDNFDDYLSRVAIHGTSGGRRKDGSVRVPHDIEANLTQEDYIQMAANVVTAPGQVTRFHQKRGWVRYYTGEYNGKYYAAIVPEKIVPNEHDPSFYIIRRNKTDIEYSQERLNSLCHQCPQILYDSSNQLQYSKKTLAARQAEEIDAANRINVTQSAPAATPADLKPSVEPVPTLTQSNSNSAFMAAENVDEHGNSIPPSGNATKVTSGNQLEQDDVSVLSTATTIDTLAPTISLQSDTLPSVETTSASSAQTEQVDAISNDVTNSHDTSTPMSSETVESSDVSSIEAVEMDTPGTDELSDASEDSLEMGDQPGAVDVSPAEQAESRGDAVDAEGVSDLETGAPSADDDESPSALDVVAYEAVESGEISLDSVLSDDDVGAEDVASEEDNGELGPDFLSSDESSVADQTAAAESVDSAQDALSEPEMDDGDEVGVESEAGFDGELGAESDAADVPSSELSLESSEETAEIDDGSLDVEEQEAVEDVAALEDAASVEDEGDIDLDAVLSVEPAMEDQMDAVDSNDDELDFVPEAEIAELEASLSDSDAALDDDFLSLGEHDDMAVQDSPSAFDDTTDLQDDFLDADDTSSVDSVDDDFLSMDNLAVDEEDLSDSAVDAGDELGVDEPADVGFDADRDGFDIDADSDTDATDIDADDDDDVSESGGFSL